MKKIVVILMTALLAMGMIACGGSAAKVQTAAAPASAIEQPEAAATEAPAEKTAEPAVAPEETNGPEQSAEPAEAPEAPAAEPAAEPAPHKTVLVVVFSATGTTKGVAEKIAAIEDADLYEILAAEPYSDADLNWHDSNSRTTKEQDDRSARPAIASDTTDLSGYERIYVGYPIWWGEEPRILDTFVESYDFGSAVMIPFCTSASSGIGRSGRNLADHANGGSWLDGKRFPGNVSESDLENWISGLR